MVYYYIELYDLIGFYLSTLPNRTLKTIQQNFYFLALISNVQHGGSDVNNTSLSNYILDECTYCCIAALYNNELFGTDRNIYGQ